jgi:hypothetical protein
MVSAGSAVIAGFVVDAGPGDASSSKLLPIRAIAHYSLESMRRKSILRVLLAR